MASARLTSSGTQVTCKALYNILALMSVMICAIHRVMSNARGNHNQTLNPNAANHAGGRASDDALRSLVVSQRFLNTKEVFVIHHTECGEDICLNTLPNFGCGIYTAA